jgi:ubiquinone/menaquinone biosynthesis C-methylase UbiE
METAQIPMISAEELDAWMASYDPEGMELNQIKKMVDLKGKDVLEIGCGTGRVTFKLDGYHKLTAVDMVEEYIEFCKKKNKKKIEFITAKAGSLPFEDASFDVVLATWSLDGADNFGSVLWDISRLLRPKGVLLIIDKSGLGDFEEIKNICKPGYKKKVRMVNNELKRQLERFFSKVDQQNLYIPEVYPNTETAEKMFIFEMETWDQTPVEKKADLRKELEKFVRNGKVSINRGVMFLKATG